jgi:CDP-2,3-bis-(O-geranylgeranyl)-sn-glycerol synthase
MDQLWLSVRLLLLLAVANGSPILAKRVLGARWCLPLDGGLRFLDGRPLLGPSKTVRGVIVATVASALAAPLLGVPTGLGALVGAAAMTGDALSSFLKRRLGVAPSVRVMGLDQIPEALLPLLAVHRALDLSPLQVAGITLLFFVLEIPVTRLSYRLGIREAPH